MALVIQTNTVTKKTTTSKPQAGMSIVDPSWESIDPNPDIRALFVHFNDTFFDGALAGCEVRWSPRMTFCAGLCVYEGRGGLCSIRLSEALLKFRPRKDLVETLLHEMIHAYLFVTVRDRDRDGHGPQFQTHMRRINAATGANITIYHNFNDEVAYHRQHWWRCKGPCRYRAPYFGYVKRATNRAPGPNDTWHKEHQENCGGEFEKIKEPEGYSSKKSAKDSATTGNASQRTPRAKKRPALDNRFPGQGHVLGEGTAVKMRRLEEYFSTRNDDEDNSKDTSIPNVGISVSTKPAALEEGAFSSTELASGIGDQAVRTSCPVCQMITDSAFINEHLDKCLTKSMLKDEAGASSCLRKCCKFDVF